MAEERLNYRSESTDPPEPADPVSRSSSFVQISPPSATVAAATAAPAIAIRAGESVTVDDGGPRRGAAWRKWTPVEVVLKDFLSEVARKERRSLLAAAVVGCAVALTGLIPDRITTLGLEFGQADQRWLLILFGLVVAYYVSAFTIYAWTDYLAWQYAAKRALEDRQRQDSERDDDTARTYEATLPVWIEITVRPASRIRASFDFYVPVIVGIIAIALLIHAALNSKPRPPTPAQHVAVPLAHQPPGG